MTQVDFYDKDQSDALLSAKADKSTTYTKTEVDTALGAKANSADVYTKTEVDTALAGKVDTATLDNYATKTYVDGKRTVTPITNLSELADFMASANVGDEIVCAYILYAGVTGLLQYKGLIISKTATDVTIASQFTYVKNGNGRLGVTCIYKLNDQNFSVKYVTGFTTDGQYTENTETFTPQNFNNVYGVKYS